MSKVQPLGDRVAVKLVPAKKTSAGGIELNNEHQEILNEGEVVSVGTERYFGNTAVPLAVRLGDHVLFHKRSGFKYNADEGEDLVLLKEEEVLAVINQ